MAAFLLSMWRGSVCCHSATKQSFINHARRHVDWLCKLNKVSITFFIQMT
jgi:isopentenyldiphosphate isomerase